MHHEEPTIESLQAEIQELKQRLGLYRGIIDNLQIGVVLYHLEDPDNDCSLRVTEVNPSASAQSGVMGEQWIGKTIDQVVTNAVERGTAKAYADSIRSNTPLSMEYINYDDDRQIEKVFEITAIPLPNDHIAVLFENTTERKRAELTLLDREAQIRTVLSHAPLVLFAFGRDGVVTVSEGRALDQLGLQSNELVGRTIQDLYRNQPSVLAAAQRALAGNVAISEAEINGTLFETRYTPVLSEDGQVVRVIGVSTDITARRQAEEALRQSLAQEELINAQAAALRELSTPLIPLADEIVVMPLIGNLDSTRTQQVMETLLEGIVAHQAAIAILDITGVPVVDTQVADSLLRTARAVKLLGAQVVLTGIASGVAQSLIHLGADLGDIVTLSNLQSGINYAMEQV